MNEMKVYLVKIDNGEQYEDYDHRIENVFLTFRGASEWLVEQGFEPYAHINSIYFHLKEEGEYYYGIGTRPCEINAEIIEQVVIQK